MASAANESHATSRAAADDENWKYVECAKCREGAVVQDKQDPGNHAIRADFQLTACGHVACEKCLQVSKGEDGSQTCPKCQLPLQDWISILDAQHNPSLAIYFRSVETMLAEFTQTIRFQTSNLRDQAAFYKNIANKQSAALKITKNELAELRAMKKNHEALQRENAALKQQLASTHQAHTSPLMQQPSYAQPQQEAVLQHEQFRPHERHTHGMSARVEGASRYESGNHQPTMTAGGYESYPQYQNRLDRHDEPKFREPGGMYTTGAHKSSKRSVDEAGLSFPPISLPPRLRESELPANAMSSAHRYDDHARDEAYERGNETHVDTSDFLNQFRFQEGQTGAPVGRGISRQSNTRSPRGQVYAPRRSSSRSSRSDLPAIEEAPFQQNAVRGGAAHPTSAGYSRSGNGYKMHERPPQNGPEDREASRNSHNHGDPQAAFVQTSVLQQAPAFNTVPDDVDRRQRTFRPLIASQNNNDTNHIIGEIRQARRQENPRSFASQRPFQSGTARPATAQAGSTSNQQYVRPQQQVTRPATAQASSRSTSRIIRPMAIPPPAGRPSQARANRGGSAFKYHPE